MGEESKEKGFVIKDRRLFDESGAVRAEEGRTEERKPAPGVEEPQVPPEEKAPPEEKTPPEEETPPQQEEQVFPEINFTGFIFSLSTTAMYHFGDFPDPVTKETRKNLPAAKQTIDILSILRTKTEGNLDEDEKQLLDGILFELRMRFVKEMSKR